ncbi:hypothetical protein BKA70DRAFT_1400535 [Coprinopsis sp. MPI-PUGE-AT-0042]|nr:hypothetical protein BKA70DRAFT_1400535 [Coprinopsis sp. MPI-PUGE-AT-0042]
MAAFNPLSNIKGKPVRLTCSRKAWPLLVFNLAVSQSCRLYSNRATGAAAGHNVPEYIVGKDPPRIESAPIRRRTHEGLPIGHSRVAIVDARSHSQPCELPAVITARLHAVNGFAVKNPARLFPTLSPPIPKTLPITDCPHTPTFYLERATVKTFSSYTPAIQISGPNPSSPNPSSPNPSSQSRRGPHPSTLQDDES